MTEKKGDTPSSPDVYFEPIVHLPQVEVHTLEEEEEEILKLRAKLFRYVNDVDPPEWKERGTGDIKFLQKIKEPSKIRLLMRREKTLKICCNHYITTDMSLKPNCGSDRAWVWKAPADFTDEEAKPETLAIRFSNSENAQKFRNTFEKYKKLIVTTGNDELNGEQSSDGIDEKISENHMDKQQSEINNQPKTDNLNIQEDMKKPVDLVIQQNIKKMDHIVNLTDANSKNDLKNQIDEKNTNELHLSEDLSKISLDK